MSLESESGMDRLENLQEKVKIAKASLKFWEKAVTCEVIIRAGKHYDNCKKTNRNGTIKEKV